MATYVLRRLIQAIPILIGISIISFIIVNVAPGTPFDRFRSNRVPPEVINNLNIGSAECVAQQRDIDVALVSGMDIVIAPASAIENLRRARRAHRVELRVQEPPDGQRLAGILVGLADFPIGWIPPVVC